MTKPKEPTQKNSKKTGTEGKKNKLSTKDALAQELSDFLDTPKIIPSIKTLTAITSKEHLSEDELNKINEERKLKGQELADKIFELSNKTRITELDTYIETIQDAVRGKNSAENQAILRTACSYFKEKYRQWCRDRGKSVEIIDNITHRTGKESHDLLAKILHGFDVKALSTELWDLQIKKKFAELRTSRQQLYDLTNDQINELREEYNTIPSQKLAAIIHTALNATNMAEEPQPDVDAIIYLLRGRNAVEIKQIEFQFNEIYHFNNSQNKEPLLREQLKQKLDENNFKQIEKLLKGFSSRELATDIHRLLVHCSEASEEVEEGIKLHPDFAGNFRRSYAKAPTVERELRAREAIDSCTNFLTQAQFKTLNKQLEHYYSEKLTPALYSCNYPFDPRKKAIQLYRAFEHTPKRRLCRKEQDYLDYSQLLYIKSKFSTSTHSEITTIINKWAYEQKSIESFHLIKNALLPVANLTPNEIFYVKEWFYVCTGKKIKDYLDEKINSICQNEVPKYVITIIKDKLTGTSRLPLKADLFDLFPSAEQRRQNYLNLEPAAKQLAQAKEDAQTITNILNDRLDSRRNKELLTFLKTKDKDQSNALEKEFLTLSGGKPLIEKIREKIVSKDVQIAAILLLSQFDVEKQAKQINDSPNHLLSLLPQTPQAISYVLKEYKNTYKKDLLTIIKNNFKQTKDKDTFELLLSVIFTPNVLKLHKYLKTNDVLSEEALTYLIKQLSRPRLEVLAFEASHNHFFGKFEYCQSEPYGSLLQQLRVLASKEFLPREQFASAILLLENVDPSVPLTMQNHLSVKDIGGATIVKFHALLREFKSHLKILQKAFNALNEKITLRETVYDLKIPLEVKNKTLLLLDGFDPDAVAKEISDVVTSKLCDESLGQKVLSILAEPTTKKPNARIPKPINWIGEMYHQIRISYEGLTGRKLLADLAKKGVPQKGFGINAISYKLYGEVAKNAIDLRQLIGKRGTEEDKMDIIERKIVQLLADLVPALRERVVNMYDAYFADAGGSLPLKNEIKSFKNEIVRENGLALIKETLVWDLPNE